MAKNEQQSEAPVISDGALAELVSGVPAAIRPMAADAPEAGYEAFAWQGAQAFRCLGCAYSTELEDAIKDHVRQVHPVRRASGSTPPTAAPQLRKGGVVRAVFDEHGNVTGYEEVKDGS